MPRPFPTDADIQQIRTLYELEKGLADRLRQASDTERPGLYNVVYDEYFRSLPEGTAPHPNAEQTELQLRLLAPFLDQDSSFLEIGSGDGALARAVAGRVGRVVTVDASRVVAESGGDLPANLIHVMPENMGAMEPGSIDVAFSCHFLEHLHPADLEPHLRQTLRVLKPGAPYVMVTPNRLYGPHDISGYFADIPEGFHLREYSHGDLAAAARQAGFNAVKTLHGIGRPPSLRSPALTGFQELCLALLGRPLRRLFLEKMLGRRAPFRPLEQVMLVAWKGPRPA